MDDGSTSVPHQPSSALSVDLAIAPSVLTEDYDDCRKFSQMSCSTSEMSNTTSARVIGDVDSGIVEMCNFDAESRGIWRQRQILASSGSVEDVEDKQGSITQVYYNEDTNQLFGNTTLSDVEQTLKKTRDHHTPKNARALSHSPQVPYDSYEGILSETHVNRPSNKWRSATMHKEVQKSRILASSSSHKETPDHKDCSDRITQIGIDSTILSKHLTSDLPMEDYSQQSAKAQTPTKSSTNDLSFQLKKQECSFSADSILTDHSNLYLPDSKIGEYDTCVFLKENNGEIEQSKSNKSMSFDDIYTSKSKATTDEKNTYTTPFLESSTKERMNDAFEVHDNASSTCNNVLQEVVSRVPSPPEWSVQDDSEKTRRISLPVKPTVSPWHDKNRKKRINPLRVLKVTDTSTVSESTTLRRSKSCDLLDRTDTHFQTSPSLNTITETTEQPCHKEA